MRKLEYLAEAAPWGMSAFMELRHHFNQRGQEGWEVIHIEEAMSGIDHKPCVIVFYKREVEPEAAKRPAAHLPDRALKVCGDCDGWM